MPTPLKYNPAYHDDWAWSLAIKGATDQDIADAFHVSRRTIIRWRQTYPSFNTACQSGKEVADAKVKKSLFERAVGFEYQEKESVIDVDPRTGEQKPVRVRTLTKKAVPDTMAQIYDNMTASSEKYLGSGNLLLFWTLLKSLLNGHESSINDLLARVKLLELILSADVTGNPYYVTFNTLTDVVVSSGIWNKSDGRIEF